MQNSLSIKIASLCVAAGLMFSAAQAQTTVNATLVGGTPIRNDTLTNAKNNYKNSDFLLVGQFAGSGSTPGQLMRSVLQFSLADAAIPQGSVIQSVKLVINITENDQQTTNNISLNLGLYELTQPFNPLEASWNNAATDTAWTTIGGTFDSTPLASQTIAESTKAIGTYEFESTALTALVQQSLSSGSNLVDLLLKLESESNVAREMLRIAFKHNSGANAPYLEITYAPIPEASHVGIALGAAALGLVALRRRMKRA